jgi:hypothetical protein
MTKRFAERWNPPAWSSSTRTVVALESACASANGKRINSHVLGGANTEIP